MVNIQKFQTLYFILFLLFMQLFLKILSGMANSIALDQTALLSSLIWSALFAYAILSDTLVFEILGHLWVSYIQQ